MLLKVTCAILQLYTITRPEARKKLTDDIVGEIAVNSRIYFSHRETVADGFKEILTDYRSVQRLRTLDLESVVDQCKHI